MSSHAKTPPRPLSTSARAHNNLEDGMTIDSRRQAEACMTNTECSYALRPAACGWSLEVTCNGLPIPASHFLTLPMLRHVVAMLRRRGYVRRSA